ncbi:hypothetical protein CH375_14605 [Leptospira ellisii]|uniref:Uncharacterized protein n=1 Tax=Leptospira ellisii TaxID=2023197 RepID=A0A2N0BIJ3_9LEPT|nr:hypothetical protein CH379_19140 [Leptospira ellisii]PKA03835.1 hypothetical protein CH375_14605 [Leptospira ellisii]
MKLLKVKFGISLFVTIVTINSISCSAVYKITGRTISSYSEDHLIPFLLESGDLDSVCNAGVSLAPLIASFERVSKRPDLPVMVAMLGAGMCAERNAQEAELLYLASVRRGKGDEATDHQAVEIRNHAVAAKRFGQAYKRFVSYFGEWNGRCPSLSEEDQFYYLIGLSSSLLAILHDRAAQGAANVPTDIPSIVSGASKCLDAERWWGVPLALEAVVWLSIPGATPAGKDPFQQLDRSVVLGDKAGVSLSRAFQIQALTGRGNQNAIKKAVQDHSKFLEKGVSRREFQLLEAYAEQLSRHESDKIWIKEKGHRGPLLLGSFPQGKRDLKEDDDLLKDL